MTRTEHREAVARQEIKTLSFPKLVAAYRQECFAVAELDGSPELEAAMLKEILDRYAKACEKKK